MFNRQRGGSSTRRQLVPAGDSADDPASKGNLPVPGLLFVRAATLPLLLLGLDHLSLALLGLLLLQYSLQRGSGSACAYLVGVAQGNYDRRSDFLRIFYALRRYQRAIYRPTALPYLWVLRRHFPELGHLGKDSVLA